MLDMLTSGTTVMGATMWQERHREEIDLGDNVKRAADQVKAALA